MFYLTVFTGHNQLYSLGRSPINVGRVKKGLIKYPNREFANNLIQGLEFGFKLKYGGPRIPYISDSKEIVGEKARIAEMKISKEISLGRIAGPFPQPPFPTFRASPISVIPKKSSSEYRLIHNLSYPPHQSVNDYIDKEDCSVKYSSIDEAIEMIQNLGSNALLAKCDVKSAFRLLRLSPSEFDLTGFKFQDQYYFDKCLPMGASISCSLFESFSTALHWYTQEQSPSKHILHYLDDFLFGGKANTSQCSKTLSTFKYCCADWGVPLAEEKTVEPTEKLIFLGIEFDTTNMVMRLPNEKLLDLRKKIKQVINSKKVTLRDLQSLIGSLIFACQVVIPGRAFCRRLIDATCNLREPHHHTRVTKNMREDLKLWLLFLENFNGTTVMLDKFWYSNADLELFTDSAGGIGFGVYFNKKWAQSLWPTEWVQKGICSDITFLELFPVVAALYIWQSDLKNKKILFHVDNQAVVTIINKKSSKSPRVMGLVRKMVLVCLEANILIKSEFLPGYLNVLADSLSRSDFQKFRRMCPDADKNPAVIPLHLWEI